MSYSFIKHAYSSVGFPEFDQNLFSSNEIPSSNNTELSEPIKNTIFGATMAPMSLYAAKKIPGKFLDGALLSNPKNRFDKGYQNFFDKVLTKTPFVGRHKTPKGRMGKALLLSSLLGGTLAGTNSIKEENDIYPTSDDYSLINNDKTKDLLKTTGYTLGSGALGTSVGLLLKNLMGTDSNLLPILLGLGGAGLGYGYSKGYNLNDIKNLFNK